MTLESKPVRATKKTAVLSAGRKGAGVFAVFDLEPGEVIERARVLLIPGNLAANMIQEDIGNYVFEWTENAVAIALGDGSFYNHSFTPNAVYRQDFETERIEFTARVRIRKGEEILVNYNQDPDDGSPVWFEVLP